MIPSPFTADLARDHQSTLVARPSRRPTRPPRRSLWRPPLTAPAALARSVRSRPPAACAAC